MAALSAEEKQENKNNDTVLSNQSNVVDSTYQYQFENFHQFFGMNIDAQSMNFSQHTKHNLQYILIHR